MNQLLVPRFEHLSRFLNRKLIFLRRLQKRIFLSNDSVVICQSLHKRRINRRNSRIEKAPARFRQTAHDFQLVGVENDGVKLSEITVNRFLFSVDRKRFRVSLKALPA